MQAYVAPSPSAKPRYRLRLVEGRWTCIPLPLGPPLRRSRLPLSLSGARLQGYAGEHPPGRSPALATIPGSSGGDGSENNRAPPTEPDPFKVVEFELVREPEQSEPDPEPPSKRQRPPSSWEEHTFATLLEQKNNGH
jgi:hypothetical protein